LSEQRTFTVGELTKYLRSLIGSDPVLAGVAVRGEISNFKLHGSSGHMYFTMKDEQSSLRCVMFRSRGRRLRFAPEDGMKIVAYGYVDVYERGGQYQLYVESLQPDGLGELHLAFEQLKRRLEKEGLFDPARKKPLPVIPRRLGVVTSLHGAAVRDIISVSRRRFPGVGILICPVSVQGDRAAPEIRRAIELMNAVPDVDVIVVGRGGGSLEELWAFNEEEVARAVFASVKPVVSAVGHETDVTITDLVADLRAPTPSAAAEACVPDVGELSRRIRSLLSRCKSAAVRSVRRGRDALRAALDSPWHSRPFRGIDERRQNADALVRRLVACGAAAVDRKRSRFETLAGRLDALSPLAVLGRGYCICSRLPSRARVTSVSGAGAGDRIAVGFSDGELVCLVENKEEGSGWRRT